MNRLFLSGRMGDWIDSMDSRKGQNSPSNRINRTMSRAGGRFNSHGFAANALPKAVLAAALLLALAGAQDAHAQGPQFSHQTIFVTDLDRAANFYEKVMELKRISEPFHDGKHIWFRVSEHGQLHVVSGAKTDVPHDISIHLAFSVPDMAAFTRHLDAEHVKYGNWAQNSKTPQIRPDKVLQIYLQDPDGYWIEVNDDKF